MKARSGNKEIGRTGKSSCTIVIPKRFAERLGLDKPSHVLIEKVSDGLLVKKLEVGP